MLQTPVTSYVCIPTGLLLDSAQLVCLLELVAGSEISADQLVISAAWASRQQILQLVCLMTRVT